MTATPSEMISSSINTLPVWYYERAPISYRLRLLGPPGHGRIYNNLHYYSNLKSAFRLILFLSDNDVGRFLDLGVGNRINSDVVFAVPT
jgi:hypothetical protein